MKSMNFLSKLLYVKVGIILLLCAYLQSCVKDEINDISSNIMLKQSFSLPLGPKEVNIDDPLISDTSSKHGNYGNFYYDGRPYPSNFPLFAPVYDTVNLNLSANPNWIKKLTFRILSENDYPSQVALQVYLIDGEGNPLDRFFNNSNLLTNEAKFNSNGEEISPSQNIAEIVYEGSRLELLKKTKYLAYKVDVFSIFINPVKLSKKNKFKVTIGVKAELEYNAKDLNK